LIAVVYLPVATPIDNSFRTQNCCSD